MRLGVHHGRSACKARDFETKEVVIVTAKTGVKLLCTKLADILPCTKTVPGLSEMLTCQRFEFLIEADTARQ